MRQRGGPVNDKSFNDHNLNDLSMCLTFQTVLNVPSLVYSRQDVHGLHDPRSGELGRRLGYYKRLSGIRECLSPLNRLLRRRPAALNCPYLSNK
jgi:hypothetical protein